MFHTIDKWNVRLGNSLDVDLKIMWSPNVQSKYVLLKKVIMHATMAKRIVTARYMHLWHECLATTNGKIMVRLKTETELLLHRLSCTLSPLLHKCSVSVFSITMIFPFFIARHSCHICIYILVTVVFAVVACTINFIIKTYLLSPFLVILWWLWTFYNKVILRFTSKAFPRRTFRTSIAWSINCSSFFLFLFYPFEKLFM